MIFTYLSRRALAAASATVVGMAALLALAPSASAAVPPAPTPVGVTAGNTQVTVSWGAAPTATRYIVSAFLGGTGIGGCSTATNDGATSCVVTGLTNGTTYSFYVQGQNNDGTGAQSGTLSIAPFAPSTVPGAPTGVAATAANGCLNVTWAAPASNGGAPIANYTATAWTGDNAIGSRLTVAGLSASLCSLTNGTPYYVDVWATNVRGNSAASSPRVTAYPNVIPGAPINVTATAGDRSVTVTWSKAPGSGVTQSEVRVWSAPSGGSIVGTSGAYTESATISGLTNGTTYYVDVYNQNELGSGPPSARVAVTPRAASSGGGGSSGGPSTGGGGSSGSGSSGSGGSSTDSGSGASTASPADDPTITKVAPVRGTTKGGTRITIRGTNFTGATKVSIAGKAMKNVKVVNATTITATTPTGTVGAKPITITTPKGSATRKAAFTYTRPA